MADRDPANDHTGQTWNSYGETCEWECWDDAGSKSWRCICTARGGYPPPTGVDAAWLTITSITKDDQPLTQGPDWAFDEGEGGDTGDGVLDPWRFITFTAGMAEGSTYELFGSLT